MKRQHESIAALALRPEVIEKFWMKVDKSGECWLWMGHTTIAGYGSHSVGNGLFMRTHRLSWLIHTRIFPGEWCVCHHCDVKPCVNPAHLFLGTLQDNALDCARKGRLPNQNGLQRGAKNPRSILTDEAVRYIRSSSAVSPVLAAELGVCESNIRLIRARKTWTHVE